MKMFVVISCGRSGSTLLTRTLNTHPEIKCEGEFLKETLDRNTSVEEQISILYKDSKNYSCGCKVFYGHIKKSQWKWFKNNNINVIHLCRTNHLKRYVSLLIARKTDRWVTSSDPMNYDTKVNVNIESFIKNVNRTKSYQEWANKFFINNEILNVCYEDLDKKLDFELNRVCDFLNVKQYYFIAKTKKQNSRDLKDLIINYNEVYDFLKEYKKGEYLKWIN